MGGQSSCCTQTNIQQVYINEINLSDHNQMMIRESTMKYDNQDEISDNITLFTEKKPYPKIAPFICVGPHIDDASKQQLYTMQESLKEIDKYVRSYGYTKSDTTLSQGDHDMGSKYTRSKYTFNDQSSNYTAMQSNDPQYIRKGALLDPNGNTYGALHQNTGHLYAVKTNVAEKWVDASYKCKNLCRCFSIYEQDNGLDVIYEHISGESLQKIISSFNTFQEKLIAIFARQIFKGLDFLHTHDLVHGNLKISNVLIDNDAIMKITDLNIFKPSAQVLNYLKSTSSAPETLLRNELTSKSDIWSAGIVLLEMAAGNPWVLKSGELMTKDQVILALNRNQKFQIPTKIKKDFQDFLHHVLQIDPSKRLNTTELLKHRFLKGDLRIYKVDELNIELYYNKTKIDAEQEERSLLNQVSMKEKTIYSQTSQLSRKGVRTNSNSKHFEITSTNNQPSSYQHELKSFKSQKSDGATSNIKYMNMQNQSKFFPSPSMTSMRDLNPDENSHNRLDPHSPIDSKYNIPKQKNSLTKTPGSMSKKITNEYGRGQTTGSRVSYIKMLSVGENDQYVDDKSLSQSQIINCISPNPQATAIIIANTLMEDFSEKGDNEQNKVQVQDKLKFIEQRMNQIMENTDQNNNSEMFSFPAHSPVAMENNGENTFSFIQIPTGLNQQLNANSVIGNNGNSIIGNNAQTNNTNNNANNNNNNTNSYTNSQSYNGNIKFNCAAKTISELKLKVNDESVGSDFFSNNNNKRCQSDWTFDQI